MSRYGKCVLTGVFLVVGCGVMAWDGDDEPAQRCVVVRGDGSGFNGGGGGAFGRAGHLAAVTSSL
jgi:hypothetical protein